MDPAKIGQLFTDVPARPSVFIGVTRAIAERVPRELGTSVEFRYRFCGNTEPFHGTVASVHAYPDGCLACLKPHPGDGLRAWECVPLWIPQDPRAGCGILAVWQTGREHALAFRRETALLAVRLPA